MPPKKAEGSAAPKAKSTHATYQVRRRLSVIWYLGVTRANSHQDMITDAIVNVCIAGHVPLGASCSRSGVLITRMTG